MNMAEQIEKECKHGTRYLVVCHKEWEMFVLKLTVPSRQVPAPLIVFKRLIGRLLSDAIHSLDKM